MSILYPFIYLLLGYLLGKTRLDLKNAFSLILTKLAIPVVIVWNVAMYADQITWIIISTLLITLLLFLISHAISKSAIQSLCFCYLNIGWLGLPIALALLGDQAARIMLAAYIGSSIFGNSIGANYLSSESISLRKILLSPPIIALLLGCGLIPFNNTVAQYGLEIYQLSKFLMGLLGMTVLGIWLSATIITRKHMLSNAMAYLTRIGLFFSALFLFAYLTDLLGWHFVANNIEVLLLICLLPPAANIIVLETHYRGSGESATKISCETILSIGAIVLYGIIITYVI